MNANLNDPFKSWNRPFDTGVTGQTNIDLASVVDVVTIAAAKADTPIGVVGLLIHQFRSSAEGPDVAPRSMPLLVTPEVLTYYEQLVTTAAARLRAICGWDQP